jgi:hypothetical protein
MSRCQLNPLSPVGSILISDIFPERKKQVFRLKVDSNDILKRKTQKQVFEMLTLTLEATRFTFLPFGQKSSLFLSFVFFVSIKSCNFILDFQV